MYRIVKYLKEHYDELKPFVISKNGVELKKRIWGDDYYLCIFYNKSSIEIYGEYRSITKFKFYLYENGDIELVEGCTKQHINAFLQKFFDKRDIDIKLNIRLINRKAFIELVNLLNDKGVLICDKEFAKKYFYDTYLSLTSKYNHYTNVVRLYLTFDEVFDIFYKLRIPFAEFRHHLELIRDFCNAIFSYETDITFNDKEREFILKFLNNVSEIDRTLLNKLKVKILRWYDRYGEELKDVERLYGKRNELDKESVKYIYSIIDEYKDKKVRELLLEIILL